MSKERPSCLKSCLFPVFVLTFLAGFFLVIGIMIIFSRTENVIGPPAPWLNFRQRLTYSMFLLWNNKELTEPLDPNGKEEIFFIEFGEPISSIAGRLWENEYIGDPDVFQTYLQYTGMDTSIQAGEHRLSPSMTPIEVAMGLKDAIPTHVTFVVIPGWRIEEIGETLPTSGLEFSKDEFLELAYNPPFDLSLSQELPDGASLEGFLYPDTYRLPREISVNDFILTLSNNFELQITQEIRQGIKNQGLDLFEGTILASIVEREAIVESEKPMIASVFLNRLAAGMPLASDPTVQYALNYNEDQRTWWTNPLSLQNLNFNSPYNTYIYTGLPPGPIANPDKTSFRAVAFPAQTIYLYFRASCDNSGRHTFSETYEEHLTNACP